MRGAAAFGFLLAVLPLVLTPGYSLALATRATLAGRRGGAAVVAVGTAAGIGTHATLTALGLSAVVMASAVAFRTVQLVGAAYLVGLGLWSLRRGLAVREATTPTEPGTVRGLLATAYVGNVLNVKAAGIYLTLAPAFVAPHAALLPALLGLAAVHAVAQTVWLLAWSRLLRRGGRALTGARARAWVDRVTGVVLVAVGLRTGAHAVRTPV